MRSFEFDNVEYRVLSEEERTLSVGGLLYNIDELHVPGSVLINGEAYSVVEISENAFTDRCIDKLTISNNIKRICREAFLRSSIGEFLFDEDPSLTEIREFAFSKSQINCFACPKSLMFIRPFAFEMSSLNEVVFANECCVKVLESNAFSSTRIRSVRVPASVEVLGSYVFSNCASLAEIQFEEGSALVDIRDYAFAGCGLKAMVVPKRVKTIGIGALSACNNLSRFILSDQLVAITRAMFRNDKMLRAIVIPKSVQVIESGAFSHCHRLESVQFETGSQLEAVKASAFEACSFPRIQFPPYLKHLQRKALSPNMKMVHADLSQCSHFENHFQPFCDTAFISYHHDALRKMRLTVAIV